MFCGMMDYFPNVDGVTWFANDILPRVREEFPEARFTIVGANPAPEVSKLAELEGVEVTGWVEDTRPWLERAAVSVAPLRVARGIQNKVLEAMGMGLPIVATPNSVQGVAARSNVDYLVEESAEGIAARVRDLLREPERARALGAQARAYVEEHYDWERIMDDLTGILDRCVERFEARSGAHARSGA
jgi:glycosyltransferase involved in cell wall biosynthesis